MNAADRDILLLYGSRGLRMFAYGFLSVLLALYLAGLGYGGAQIGVLLSVALAGSAVTTAAVSLLADRWGRRRTLVLSSLLLAGAGLALAAEGPYPLLLLFAAVGTMSPTGQEVGPYQSLEQAALARAGAGGAARAGGVHTYAWYNLVGSLAGAFGALAAGLVPPLLVRLGWSEPDALRSLLWAFVACGLVLAVLSALLSAQVEPPAGEGIARATGGLHRSRGIVLRLTALFGLDSLAGGLVVQSLVAFWFHQRFGVGLEQLGPLFFGTNLLSALSFLAAARLAERFGLLNTMVFTHLPSNLLLALVPFMPTWQLAAAVLLARHTLSQMDVPTRQAYTMAVVAPSEQAAAAGLTNAVRTGAASVAPLLSGFALQFAASGLPFVISGGLKAIYDIGLWLTFRRVPLDGEGS
jgi:MFS family permease